MLYRFVKSSSKKKKKKRPTTNKQTKKKKKKIKQKQKVIILFIVMDSFVKVSLWLTLIAYILRNRYYYMYFHIIKQSKAYISDVFTISFCK